MGCSEDSYIGSGVALKRTLSKHGESTFVREIISYHYGKQQELYDKEERLLKKIDVGGDRKSYNMKNKGLGQAPVFVSALFKGKKKDQKVLQNNGRHF